MHMRKTNVAPNFLPKSHLQIGKLSVYRLSDKAEFDRSGVVAAIEALPFEKNSLSKILGPLVREIREVRISGIPGRVFCVRDECDTDDQGGKHHAHAHIALCEHFFPEPIDKDSDFFKQAYADLSTLFRANEI
ncbi:MAG: hypothetical protein EOP06_21640 [Proteobacteria bacterium]|nr:MAG: hypothetical protein EOP06_21640 [Pseudomonadota bacterium]